MYSSPGSATVRKTTWPVFAGIFCLSLILFAIAAMIILALIPVYLTNRSTSANPNVFRSKDITMMAEVEENNNNNNTRRRRKIGDLYRIVGGTFGSEGNEMIRQQLLAVLPGHIVRDVVVLSCSLGYQGYNKKRRFALSKRAVYVEHVIILVIRFYIIFQPTCFFHCQLSNGISIRSLLYVAPRYSVLNNLPIFINQVFLLTEIRIILILITYVSEILPDSGRETPGSSPAIITLTSTATTAAGNTTSVSVTPLIG